MECCLQQLDFSLTCPRWFNQPFLTLSLKMWNLSTLLHSRTSIKSLITSPGLFTLLRHWFSDKKITFMVWWRNTKMDHEYLYNYFLWCNWKHPSIITRLRSDCHRDSTLCESYVVNWFAVRNQLSNHISGRVLEI